MKRCIRRRAGIERELTSRADQRGRNGNVERMNEYLARMVLIAEVSERPRLGRETEVREGDRG